MILLDNSFIELPGSKLEVRGQGKVSYNSHEYPLIGNTKRSQLGLEEVLGEIKRKQHLCVKLHLTQGISAILAN